MVDPRDGAFSYTNGRLRPFCGEAALFETLSGTCVRETGTLEAQTFLERHSPRMIRIAKDTSPEVLGNRRIARFLDRLHRDFETVEDKPGKRGPLPGEDVFWWCVTILEELTEIRTLGSRKDPYVLMMLDQLRSMGPRLEKGEPLPPEFQIHWFDDEEELEDDEWDPLSEPDGDA